MLQRKRIWLIPLVLIVAGGLIYVAATPSTTAATPTPSLQTATVRQGDIVISASGTGNLLPAVELNLGFRTSGTLLEIPVKIGDEVKAGDVLARLDDATAQAQLTQAQINLESAQIKLESAQVAAGANESDQLTSTRVNLKQVTAALADAQTNYDSAFDPARDWELNDPRRADRLKAERDAAQRALDRAKDNLAVARSQYNLAVASLEGSAAQSERDLRSAQLALEQAQLSFASARQTVSDTLLIAPIAGTVSAVNASVGEAAGGAAVITLIDMNRPVVRFWLEENDLDKLAIGNKATVAFEALPDQTFDGSVVSIEPVLATVDNTPAVQAWATIDVPAGSGRLLSGMNAEIEVVSAEARGALLVPVQALRELSPGSYAVFVVSSSGELELRPVTVGLEDAANAQILSGLQAGEVVSTGTTGTGN